ncbi:MAG: ABC transporter permease [Candidatus Zixiibacteriota bacterium]
MGTILSIALKDLLLLRRNKFALIWVVAFPLLMALFFGSIFSGESSGSRSLKIAFVGDQSISSEEFFTELNKSEVLAIRRLPLDSALDLVTRGKLSAYVRYFAVDTSGSSMFSMGRDSIEVGMDPSRKTESAYLKGLIAQAYFARMQRRFTQPSSWRTDIGKGLKQIDSIGDLDFGQKGMLKGILGDLDSFLVSIDTLVDTAEIRNSGPFGDPKIRFEEVTRLDRKPATSWEIAFPQSLIWALIGCAATFALSLLIERIRGTYTRLRLAPISRGQILAGKGLACFATCVLVCSLFMLIGAVFFHVRIESPGILAAAIVCAALCFVGIMMLISVLGKNEYTVSGAGWAILLVFSMTGGGMIPLMFMPSWISAVSNFSPMKWCILAFEGAIWRGFTWGDMTLPLGILLAIGTLGFSIGVIVMAKAER